MFEQTGSRAGPAGARTGRLPEAAWGIRVPGEAWSVGLVRGALRVWLGTLGWPDGHADDVVTATVEALTHAIRHAHPTRIEGGPLWLEAGVVVGAVSRSVEIALRPGAPPVRTSSPRPSAT
ncbi:hypothetical protein LWC35_09780 [Pseudonocardia kujensis]|uniref:ATP-binding protein n=1 Tax=Pseudonocardia kujensis TaxID=1128675 RepID=UPI001E429E1C|nr:ATP-binding protein [Pseudonocardia kujensis]MCE0763195.1 hypothetical protein [Pseudonocardia kujensis]